MQNNHFRLVTLGRLALVGADGAEDQSLAKRKRKLALLAVLASVRHAPTRDELTEMFWGDQEDARARHSLADALSHLRRVLGSEAIATRQSEVSLAPGAALVTDVREFLVAAGRGDYRAATELYAGEFLAGIDVAGSASFERWRERERAHLRGIFLECAERACAVWPADDPEGCGALAQRWLNADPLSADAALCLLSALRARATPASLRTALSEYQLLARRLDTEFDAEVDPRVASLAAEIETEAGALRPDPAPRAFLRATRSRVGRFAIATAGLAIVAVVATLISRNQPADAATPSLAVIDITPLRADSTDAWLEAGIPQLLSANLAQIDGIDVVPPERVRALLQRATIAERPVPLEKALDVGRRLGATWIVTGGISHGDDSYILDISIHDVASGELRKLYTVTDSNLVTLADGAAARLAGLGELQKTAVRFADIQTSSVDAYRHFVRSLQARDAGRPLEALQELDAAIALDSGFTSALVARASHAYFTNDLATYERLNGYLDRARRRGPGFDEAQFDALRAFQNGEHERAEALGRKLIERYPRDPRAYATVYDILWSHGRFAEAEQIVRAVLALDSLGISSGNGPCAPCVAYTRLIDLRLMAGDAPGAERIARRWLELQPQLPLPWGALAYVLVLEQRFDEAFAANRTAHSLNAEPLGDVVTARLMLAARRYDGVDSLLATWRGRPDRAEDYTDILATLQRERGQFRASAQTLAGSPLALLRANSLSRVGEYAAARAAIETSTDHRIPATQPASRVILAGTAGSARHFVWSHANIADAIAPAGDTLALRALADSVERVAGLSYYGRDWRVHHHILGLIALSGQRYAEAEREFQAARWGAGGWTVTPVQLARARLAAGKSREALQAIRDAYLTPLDAMGRYTPRSELDFMMAQVFKQLGMKDSAVVYGRHVARAWRNADPEYKRLLEGL